MPTNVTEINIQRINSTVAPWADLLVNGGEPEQVNVLRVCINEKGTMRGKASINFDIELPNGRHVIAEFTEGIFESIYTALQGAKQHWEANPL